MVPVNKISDLFSAAVDESAKDVVTHLDRYENLPNGGMRITFTVRPKNVPQVNPFDIGNIFQIKSRTYKVIGQDYGARKFKIKCERRPDGRKFRVTPQAVLDGYLFTAGK